MGLSGEAAEVLDLVFWSGTVDAVKLVKELGDVAWYCAETASTAGIDLGDVPVPPPEGGTPLDHAIRLTVRAGEVTDYLKKVVGHGHDIDVERVQTGLGLIIRRVADIAAAVNIDLPTVCERNIEKLRARYPNGFRTEQSIQRAPGDT
jgi:NTP pyrophosphatase (non-canonical NTP hydrolase)